MKNLVSLAARLCHAFVPNVAVGKHAGAGGAPAPTVAEPTPRRCGGKGLFDFSIEGGGSRGLTLPILRMTLMRSLRATAKSAPKAVGYALEAAKYQFGSGLSFDTKRKLISARVIVLPATTNIWAAANLRRSPRSCSRRTAKGAVHCAERKLTGRILRLKWVQTVTRKSSRKCGLAGMTMSARPWARITREWWRSPIRVQPSLVMPMSAQCGGQAMTCPPMTSRS